MTSVVVSFAIVTWIIWNRRSLTLLSWYSPVINGEAWWGINSGAKRSLDTSESYLGKAVATGNTEVRALHTVSKITYEAATKLYVITAVHTDEAYNTIETVTLKTPNLIMAAGSLGTTKLLVKARDTGALPNLNSHLGTRFSNNGNMLNHAIHSRLSG